MLFLCWILFCVPRICLQLLEFIFWEFLFLTYFLYFLPCSVPFIGQGCFPFWQEWIQDILFFMKGKCCLFLFFMIQGLICRFFPSFIFFLGKIGSNEILDLNYCYFRGWQDYLLFLWCIFRGFRFTVILGLIRVHIDLRKCGNLLLVLWCLLLGFRFLLRIGGILIFYFQNILH